jgi:signal transduction histidine kinase/ActR/RegA family two-component response regulator
MKTVKNLFLFLFSTVLFSLDGIAQTSVPVPANGLLDLRGISLDQTSVSLKGYWNYYPYQLLHPQDLAKYRKYNTIYPALWKEKSINQDPDPLNGYATYALTVLLPAQHPRLAVEIPDSYSSYKLFLNGKVFSQNGTPGTNQESTVPFWVAKTLNLPDNDTLQFVIQVSNFWHHKGGTAKQFLLGDQQTLQLKADRAAAFDLILAGCLFMGGLFFLGLFIFGRQDKPILYFSLFCIVYSYRMIGTGNYVLHGILPELPWLFTIRIEYLSLVTGVAVFGKYTQYLYPREVSKVIINLLVSFCLLYVLVILFTPASFFTSLINYFLIVMFIYTGYAFHTYILAMRKKRTGSVYALLSSGVMMIIFLIINLQYFGLIQPFKGFVFALYIAFFFLQSLVLSFRFSVHLKDAAVLAQEGLKAKSDFLSTMSHEIRTPLNSVIGMAHLLQRSNPRPDQHENVEVLLFSANNLLSIVNNILDYNKIEAGKIHFEQINMDVPALAKNIIAGIKTFAEEKRISLRYEIDERLNMYVVGDPTRTSQVINNLVHNAIKFTNEGYVKLAIHAEDISTDEITLLISVEDTGIGIENEKMKIIFERFTQADSSTSRKYGGTGLGLSISKKILELQGTELIIESEIGKGSKFSFRLRLKHNNEILQSREEKLVNLNENLKSLKGIGILLVEDNPMNVMVAQAFLERAGALIDVAVNGEEALKSFDGTRHRLILMDLDMPVMDGYQAARILRRQGQTVPIIALTASLPNEVQHEVYDAGLSDIMVKPFNPDDLLRAILLQLQPTERLA